MAQGRFEAERVQINQSPVLAAGRGRRRQTDHRYLLFDENIGDDLVQARGGGGDFGVTDPAGRILNAITRAVSPGRHMPERSARAALISRASRRIVRGRACSTRVLSVMSEPPSFKNTRSGNWLTGRL